MPVLGDTMAFESIKALFGSFLFGAAGSIIQFYIVVSLTCTDKSGGSKVVSVAAVVSLLSTGVCITTRTGSASDRDNNSMLLRCYYKKHRQGQKD
jgi:hypothetical protein